MTASDWRKLLLGLTALAWGGLVFAAYSIVHKPITLDQLPALGLFALTLVGWVGTLILAHGLGRFLVPFLPELSSREKFALQIGLGFGVLGLGILILGAVGGYWTPVAWAIAAAGTLLNGRQFLADLRLSLPRLPATLSQRALALFVNLTLLSALLYAFTPPTTWDALVYHLTGPKLYLAAHRLQHDIDLAYLGFPQWGSMLFLWGMLLAGPQLAQVIHVTFMALTLMLLPAVVKEIAPGRSWLAAAILAAAPTATLLASTAYVEWLTMFAGLGAFVCLMRSGGAQRRAPSGIGGPVLIAGLLTGLALGAKYTAAGLALGLCLLALFRLRSARLLIIFAIVAAAGVGPYLLKNLILTGNPVYPFFLPGKFWDGARAYWYSRPGTGLGLFDALFAPWDATVWGTEGLTYEGKVSYTATIGPLLLMLIPWVLLEPVGKMFRQVRPSNPLGNLVHPSSLFGGGSAPAESADLSEKRVTGRLEDPIASTRRQWLNGLMLVGGTAYGVWIAQIMSSLLLVQSRLLFPALPMFALLATAGFEALAVLNIPRLQIRFVMGGLIAAALAFTAFSYGTLFLQASPLPVILGYQSQSDYLVSRLGVYAVTMDRLNTLPPGSKVLFLWEPRSYYCASAACEPDVLLDRWWHLRQGSLNAAQIAARWKVEGITHVLVYETGRQGIEAGKFDPITTEDWAELKTLRTEYLKLVEDFYGAYQLYSLK